MAKLFLLILSLWGSAHLTGALVSSQLPAENVEDLVQAGISRHFAVRGMFAEAMEQRRHLSEWFQNRALIAAAMEQRRQFSEWFMGRQMVGAALEKQHQLSEWVKTRRASLTEWSKQRALFAEIMEVRSKFGEWLKCRSELGQLLGAPSKLAEGLAQHVNDAAPDAAPAAEPDEAVPAEKDVELSAEAEEALYRLKNAMVSHYIIEERQKEISKSVNQAEQVSAIISVLGLAHLVLGFWEYSAIFDKDLVKALPRIALTTYATNKLEKYKLVRNAIYGGISAARKNIDEMTSVIESQTAAVQALSKPVSLLEIRDDNNVVEMSPESEEALFELKDAVVRNYIVSQKKKRLSDLGEGQHRLDKALEQTGLANLVLGFWKYSSILSKDFVGALPPLLIGTRVEHNLKHYKESENKLKGYWSDGLADIMSLRKEIESNTKRAVEALA